MKKQKADMKVGTSREDRYLKALDPGYFMVDDRTREDLLRLTLSLARELNFVSLENTPDGNWEIFFMSDIRVFLGILSSQSDLSPAMSEYKELANNLRYRANEKKLLDDLEKLLHLLGSLFVKIHSWNAGFPAGNTIHPFASRLEKSISALSAEGLSLQVFCTQAERKWEISLDKAFMAVPFTQPAGIEKADWQLPGRETATWDVITQALPKLDNIFRSLWKELVFLADAAAQFLAGSTVENGDTPPHLTLYLAFLDLYKYLQSEINQLTGRHLGFYYKTILGLKPQPSIPDRVYLLFGLSANCNNYVLEKGEILRGEGPQGEELSYSLDESLLLGKATICKIHTIYISEYAQVEARNMRYKNILGARIYQGDHNPLPLQQKDKKISWAVLGEDQSQQPEENRTMIPAEMGFLLSSPLLYQKEGERKIILKLCLTPGSAETLKKYIENYSAVITGEQTRSSDFWLMELLSEAFLITLTGEEGWLDIPFYQVSTDQDKTCFNLIFTLGPDFPSTDLYNPIVHGGNLGLEGPAVKILLNNSIESSPLYFLRDLFLEKISIRVEVKGSSDFRIRNNFGPASPGHAFPLFGPTPEPGSFLAIENPAVFNRHIKSFRANLNWQDLPRSESGFAAYYVGYPGAIGNRSFRVRLCPLALPGINQEGICGEAPLFGESANGILSPVTRLRQENMALFNYVHEPAPGRTKQERQLSGVKIELISPSEGFGHRAYPQILPQVLLHNARVKWYNKWYRKKLPVPNPPFIPVLSSITIDYMLEQTEVFTTSLNTGKQSSQRFIHIHPFGHEPVQGGRPAGIRLLPETEHRQNLYLGMTGLEPGEEVSFLFRLQGMSFQHSNIDPPLIGWSVLSNNTWAPLRKEDVLFDSTNHLIRSGIIKLRIPKDATRGNTLFDENLYWLRASLQSGEKFTSRVEGIYLNAGSATRLLTDGGHSPVNTPPFSVSRLMSSRPEIDKVLQPFTSFGGKAAEKELEFYTRISERLRHKQRPITGREIEKVVLTAFPTLQFVKCIGPNQLSETDKKKSDLTVMVVPREIRNNNSVTPRKVYLSDLLDIKSFLKDIVSPFITLEVENPDYEEVKICCTVKFAGKNATDNGRYISLLNRDLQRFISPWLFADSADASLRESLHYSDVLAFIRSRTYVSHVTSLSIVHFYTYGNNRRFHKLEDTAVHDMLNIKISKPAALLVSAKSHDITVTDTDDYIAPRPSGIGRLAIGSEFLISEKEPVIHESGIGKLAIGYEFYIGEKKPAAAHKIITKSPEQEETFTLVITPG